jgi:hypothetical protein
VARFTAASTRTILDPGLFEAVQAKLAAQAVARRYRLRSSPALLSGRIFDERGNRMSPTHANKGGARYRYYISQAALQNSRGHSDRSSVFPQPSLRRSLLPHCVITSTQVALDSNCL